MQNQQIARLKRAVSQKNIKLISSTMTDTYLLYKVMGNTGTFYDVKVPCGGLLSCKCMDFLRNKARCKHLHFIYVKVFKLLPAALGPVSVTATLVPATLVPATLVPATLVPATLVPATLVPDVLFIDAELFAQLCTKHKEFIVPKNALINADAKQQQHVRNASEDCCICFEPTEAVAGLNSFICGTCQNGFHKDCIVQVLRFNTCCPLCRSPLSLADAHDAAEGEPDATVASLIQQIQRL